MDSIDIGMDKIRRFAVNRAVDMSFRGKMNDPIEVPFAEQIVDQRGIADIALHKFECGIAGQRFEHFMD